MFIYIRKILGMYFDISNDQGETLPHMDEQRRGGGVFKRGVYGLNPARSFLHAWAVFQIRLGVKE